MNEKRRKIKFAPILFILEMLGLIALVIFAFLIVKKEFFDEEKESSTVLIEEKDNIEAFGYKLDDRDTEYFKDTYDLLKEELQKEEIDYKNYATLLTKLFVIDFYTLSNKYTSTDIGAIEFIHPDQVDNFLLNAGRTMYKTVKSNLYGTREQVLPEVSNVEVTSVNESTYSYSGTSYKSYVVKATWQYVEDLGYDKSKTFILIQIDKKLFVVENA